MILDCYSVLPSPITGHTMIQVPYDLPFFIKCQIHPLHRNPHITTPANQHALNSTPKRHNRHHVPPHLRAPLLRPQRPIPSLQTMRPLRRHARPRGPRARVQSLQPGAQAQHQRPPVQGGPERTVRGVRSGVRALQKGSGGRCGGQR